MKETNKVIIVKEMIKNAVNDEFSLFFFQQGI